MQIATTTSHKSAQWTSFFEFSRERFIAYWLKYLIDHQAHFDNLEAEESNIKSAWINAAKQQKEADLMQAMEPLYQFYRTRGRIKDGQLLFANTLSYYTNGNENYSNFVSLKQKFVGRLLTHQAWFSQNLGKYDLAEKLVHQASPLLYQLNDTKYIAALLCIKGTIRRFGYGDSHQAKGLYYRAFKLYQALEDQWGMANTLNNLGTTNNDSGEFQMAAQLFEKAAAICHQNDYFDLLARSISNLGVSYEGLGQYSDAIESYQTCFDVCQQLQNKLGMAISLANQSQIALRQERFADAKELSLKQLILSREIDNKFLLVGGLADLGNAYYMLHHYDLAWNKLQESLEIAISIDSKPAIAQSITQIAHLFYHLNMTEKSFILLTIIHPIQFAHHHVGSPNGLYEILGKELPDDLISTIKNKWLDKSLDEAINLIKIYQKDSLQHLS